jgi:hypothetical protein
VNMGERRLIKEQEEMIKFKSLVLKCNMWAQNYCTSNVWPKNISAFCNTKQKQEHVC